MAFTPSAGLVTIGEALPSTAGHLYHFTDSLSALWCVYIDAYTRTGIIKKSTNQGLSWFQTDDVGPVDEITIRGQYAAFRSGPKVSLYDIDEGFVIFQRSYQVSGPTGNTAIGREVIPVPELGGFAMRPPSITSGANVHALFNLLGTQVMGLGGNNGLRALWGTQNNNIKTPDPAVDKIFYVASYQDPFDPVITYDYLLDSQFGEVFPRRSGAREPVELPLAHTFGYSLYEGFLSSRNSLAGVSTQGTVSSPSFFLPADNWQNGRNTAPLYTPSLASPSRNDGVFTFPVLSTPSGVQYDNTSSRAAAFGVAGRFPTFGLIEPGGNLAICRLSSSGQFFGRKFLGSFPGGIARQRVWMPYTNGIFGMGIVGTIATTKANTVSLLWAYDKDPDNIPGRAVSVGGVFEDEVETQPITSEIDSRSFQRW